MNVVIPSLDFWRITTTLNLHKYGLQFAEHGSPPTTCKHVMSIFVHAPYDIEGGAETRPQHREAFGDTVVQTLEEYCPGLSESILHRQVLTPWDLEQDFGLTEGNIFHGERV